MINCCFHLFRSSASWFNYQYLLLFLKSSRSCILLLPSPCTSVICPSIAYLQSLEIQLVGAHSRFSIFKLKQLMLGKWCTYKIMWNRFLENSQWLLYECWRGRIMIMAVFPFRNMLTAVWSWSYTSLGPLAAFLSNYLCVPYCILCNRLLHVWVYECDLQGNHSMR